jgi:hypothetical protein
LVKHRDNNFYFLSEEPEITHDCFLPNPFHFEEFCCGTKTEESLKFRRTTQRYISQNINPHSQENMDLYIHSPYAFMA